ncbi:MAG: radical SAM family heme chaperone HemW [Pirellulales bacterium]
MIDGQGLSPNPKSKILNPKSPSPSPIRSAYLHVPFCRRRCGYCNFTLVAGRDDLVEDYLRAVEREMSWLETPREVDTLFFGGGTPTHLDLASLARLLEMVRRWFPLAAGGEWSVEANPIDCTVEKAALLAAHGVTRVSLGVQSFNDGKLEVLERDHDGDQARRALDCVRRHFSSVSLDLIFATPGESLDTWNADLQTAIELAPAHISTYGLTFEKGTSFWSRRRQGVLSLVAEVTERAMYTAAIEQLSSAGFEHYEVSNFAKPGHRCRHNEAYWLGESYYAVGPGAARYVAGRRETNHGSTTTYIRRVLASQSPVAQSESLGPEDRARELLVFALRRREGVSPAWFFGRTGFEIQSLVGRELERCLEQGWLETAGGNIRLTHEGLLISDSLWPDFLRC